MSTQIADIGTGPAPAAPALREPRSLLEVFTQTVKPYERVDYWREYVCRQFADVQLASRLGCDFHGEIRGRAWGDIRLSLVNAKAQAVTRMWREARDTGEDCYFAVVLLAGSEFVEQDGRSATLRAGDITIYDGARPHRLIFPEDFQKVIMQIPRRMLQERIAGIDDWTAQAIPGTHGPGVIAASFLHSFARQARDLDEPALGALTEQSLDLLSMAATAARPGEPHRPRTPSHSLYRVKAFVEEHLSDHTLDAAAIACGTGLSVRYINQLFEREDTSLMRYVWMRRLERCRRDILRCQHSSLHLYDIALRWGFNTASHFSRAFKLQFGYSPRAYWQAHRTFGAARSAYPAAIGVA